MGRIEAWFEEDRRASEVHRRLFFQEQGAATGEPVCVDYIISGARLPAPLERADLAIPALIFEAMRRGKPLHIRGPVSRSLLDSICEFQAFWNFHLPAVYHRVEVTADSEVSGEPRHDAAVVPFSGGLDSSFTVWRHRNDSPGPGQRQIKLAFMIHGFDIPLDNQSAFDLAYRNARAMLDSIEMPLSVVRTNWKSVACTDWEMQFSAGVVGCAYNFMREAGYCLLAAGQNYGYYHAPWGENAVMTWMLSSHDFHVDYDGAASTRPEKAGAIADWTEGIAHLRVCWQGPITGVNCGRCEKCTRTKLCFMANGVPVPSALVGRATLRDVLRLHTVPVYRIVDILARAEAKGQSGAWILALRFALFRRKYLPRPLWAARRYARRWPWLRRLVRRIRGRPELPV